MKNKIQELIKWAEVRQKAYSAAVRVFTSVKAKERAEGKLAECAFFIQ